MDYPDEGEVEDMDTTPSPRDEEIGTEINLPEVITVKEEQMEACELLGEDGPEEGDAEEEPQFNEAEQQVILHTYTIAG